MNPDIRDALSNVITAMNNGLSKPPKAKIFTLVTEDRDNKFLIRVEEEAEKGYKQEFKGDYGHVDELAVAITTSLRHYLQRGEHFMINYPKEQQHFTISFRIGAKVMELISE